MSIEPTATGTLQATPFGHLLVYLLDRSLTGSLVLEEPSRSKHAIWFDSGAPAKVKTAEPVTYLGQILIEQRAITREIYERSLQTALRERRLHGQVLLEWSAIDQAALKEALREQLARQVLWLFKLPPATLFGYYDQVNFLERWGAPDGLRVRPLALIWRGLRRHATPAEIEAVVSRLGDRVIELHVDAPIRRFRFDSAEQALIDVLRARPQTLSALIGFGLAPPEDVKRLVYVLVMLRQLEMGVPGVEPVGVDEAPSSSRIPVAGTDHESVPPAQRASARTSMPDVEHVVPPSGAERYASVPPASGGWKKPAVRADAAGASPSRVPSPDPVAAALRKELEELSERATGTHYEVLGLPSDAPITAIQSAFFALAKKWHPDRVRPELADLRDQATRVFARISEASQTLSDPAKRRAYDASLSGGGDAEEHEQVQRVLRASNAFQKAEVLMKRGNLAAAEKEAKTAYEGDASQADHVALYFWIQAQKPAGDLQACAVELEKAEKAEPNNLRVRWYRGQLLKRLGREREALHEFRFIVQRDPRHTDAQREVRLYAMRRSNRLSSAPPGRLSERAPAPGQEPSKSPPPGKPGLLDKFFKKP
jgi:curved DNA-binding protein CbpA